ncbi:MAG: phosphoenolpyruvate--protein phosphotransferase [Myxococcales bacterium]|nr:phosphoenolpyruvate--protein phosphotransferase [Myxococcales bacterium]
MSQVIRLQGIAASPGIAIARARSLHRTQLLVPRSKVSPQKIAGEMERLTTAVAQARTQIQAGIDSIVTSENGMPGGNHTMILHAHLLMLEDELLIDATRKLIEQRHINAEWALSTVSNDIKDQMLSLEDPYLRERAEDIEHVSSRIMRNLLGLDEDDDLSDEKFAEDCIVVATELSPAETAQLAPTPIMAFVTETGTRTSHTAIMAQALGIPAVLGVENITNIVGPEDMLIVDGLEGWVIIQPDEKMLARYREKSLQWHAMEKRLRGTRDQPSVTSDGIDIRLSANIELPSEAPFAMDYGAQAIGLYRTEFLYLDRDHPPTAEEQFRVYRHVLQALAPRCVTFRTFDLGADKMPRSMQSRDRNPALGMRAIRIGLKNPDVLKTQIRAILQATLDTKGQARIMFPLVSGVPEMRQLNRLVAEVRAEFDADTLPLVPVGCMIELPSAVLTADLLAKEADFFSIGTNDLIQYSLAIDRCNDDVAYLYSPYHPAVLRAIHMTVTAANAAGIPVAICGTIAGEPHMTPLLIGMGIRDLSMAPSAIPFIKFALQTVNISEVTAMAKEALQMSTPDEVERLAARYMQGLAVVPS